MTRGKNKIGPVLSTKDSFKEFNKTQRKDSLLYIDYKKYKSICADFNKEIVNHILLDSGTLKLPHRLGEIRIQKKKMNFTSKENLKIDWKKTKEIGKRIYHLNDHTNNYRYKWYWTKTRAIVKNKSYYSFIPTRANKRTLASILLNTKQIDYFE